MDFSEDWSRRFLVALAWPDSGRYARLPELVHLYVDGTESAQLRQERQDFYTAIDARIERALPGVKEAYFVYAELGTRIPRGEFEEKTRLVNDLYLHLGKLQEVTERLKNVKNHGRDQLQDPLMMMVLYLTRVRGEQPRWKEVSDVINAGYQADGQSQRVRDERTLEKAFHTFCARNPEAFHLMARMVTQL